jgi:hypothetical protein
MPKPPIDPSGAAGPSGVPKDKSIESDKTITPDKSAFQSELEKAPTAPQAQAGKEISPMELQSKAGISTTPSFQTLLSQAANARDTLGDVEKNLKTPNLQLKRSQSQLLNTKLSNANDHLKAANEKLGAKVPADTQVPPDANPLTKYLGMVTDGQNKLAEAQAQLQSMNKKGTELRPGDMLLVQVKLAQAQQEIEYSSVLLSQVVGSLKQILNIQL